MWATPDRVLAASLLALNLVEVAATGAAATTWLAAVPSALLLCVPLSWRRAAPLAVTTLVVSGYAAQLAVVGYYNALAMLVAWLVAAYSLTAHAPRLHVPPGLAVALVPVWVFLSAHPTRDVSDVGPGELVLVAVPAAAGWAVRRLRHAAAAAEQRAAERDHAARVEAELAAANERARIARELHDVIAHSVSVVVVQAEAAEALLDADRDRARASLQAIQRTGRDTLAELRQMLGLLRTDDGSRELVPEPTLARLPALIEQVRAAGLDADLELAGTPRPLPAGVEHTAYRVVQEGLTNALRHAGADGARVALRYLDDALEVEVEDRGDHAGDSSGGFGLVGIRERVAAHGGTVDAGPAPDGGFALRVRLAVAPA